MNSNEQTPAATTVLGNESIELDCAPGSPRPDDLLPDALVGTGLTPDDFTITSRFFGNWTFVIHADKEQQYKDNKQIIKANITALYHRGKVRYASW